MLHLSKRLASIYRLTPHGVSIDVGADHGQLIIALVENEVSPYAYAVENKKGPFERLKKAINASKVKDKITPLFSNGIKDMPSDVKNIIIAGMGGQTIVDILKDNQEKLHDVDTLLIDSHRAFSFVRKEICSLGFYVDEEDILEEDDIIYEIMRFKKGCRKYDEDDYFFGPILRMRKDKVFILKWQKRLLEIENLLSKENIPQIRKNELEGEKERIKGIL